MNLVDHFNSVSVAVDNKDYARAVESLQIIRRWGVSHDLIDELITTLERSPQLVSGASHLMKRMRLLTPTLSNQEQERLIHHQNILPSQLVEPLLDSDSVVLHAALDAQQYFSVNLTEFDFYAHFDAIEICQGTYHESQAIHIDKTVESWDDVDMLLRDDTLDSLAAPEAEANELSSSEIDKLVELANASQSHSPVGAEPAEDSDFWAGRSALDLAGFEPLEYDFQKNAPIKKLKAQATVLSAALKTVESALQELSEADDSAHAVMPQNSIKDDEFDAVGDFGLGEAFSSEVLGEMVDETLGAPVSHRTTKGIENPSPTAPPPLPTRGKTADGSHTKIQPQRVGRAASEHGEFTKTTNPAASVETSTEQAVAIIVIEQARRLMRKGKFQSALDIVDDILDRMEYPPAMTLQKQLQIKLKGAPAQLSDDRVIIRRIVGIEDMAHIDIDPRGAFLLSRLDDNLSIDEIIQRSELGRDEVLGMLSYWLEQGIIEVISA